MSIAIVLHPDPVTLLVDPVLRADSALSAAEADPSEHMTREVTLAVRMIEYAAMVEAVASEPARSLAGVLAKARLVAELRARRDAMGTGYDDETDIRPVAYSAMADLVRLAEARVIGA